jgi:hypothetical protein
LKSNSELSGGGSAQFPEPIAIVGMGGVFPGASSLEDFWRIVEQGRDTCRTVPAGRWLLDPETILGTTPGAADSVLTNRGCFIEDASLAGELDPMFSSSAPGGRRCGAAREPEPRGWRRPRQYRPADGGGSALAMKYPRRSRRFWARGNPRERAVRHRPARRLLARSLGLGGACFTLDAACFRLCREALHDELLAHRAGAMLATACRAPFPLHADGFRSCARFLERALLAVDRGRWPDRRRRRTWCSSASRMPRDGDRYSR